MLTDVFYAIIIYSKSWTAVFTALNYYNMYDL